MMEMHEECKGFEVEFLRKELRDLKSEREKSEMKLILERGNLEIAKKEQEIKFYRDRTQLQREKVENIRQQILLEQMRQEEADEEIERLKEILEGAKVTGKTEQQLIVKRLKDVQHKLLNAPWVTKHREMSDKLVAFRKQIEEFQEKKKQLVQSISDKEAILNGSGQLPMKNFCIAIATLALKNQSIMKKLAQEYLKIAKLSQELNHGTLDISLFSQNSPRESQVEQFEEKVKEPLFSNGNADANERSGTRMFDFIQEKKADEETPLSNIQTEDKNRQGDGNETGQDTMDIVISSSENGHIEKDFKLVVIDEVEKTIEVTINESESSEVHHINDNMNNDVVSNEEMMDTGENNRFLDDLNVDSSQISDKETGNENVFVNNFMDHPEGVEILGDSEGENLIHEDKAKCESPPASDKFPTDTLEPRKISSTDLDPTNFFTQLTNFNPDGSVNLSNTYFGAETDFDASTIFNLSSIMNNQSENGSGPNDYMTLFDGVNNAMSQPNEDFEFNFVSLSSKKEGNKQEDSDH
ncbi:unnamed protein product [Thelazia callipaeda]|uniref:Epidermal growth factor receptor substrate 15 n=1 Tax=Thelazia callipaeda TaxID=103827 RepID=A0A0N5D2A2_THECL|nr:unnamed protein product [Thelazia callipaeda]